MRMSKIHKAIILFSSVKLLLNNKQFPEKNVKWNYFWHPIINTKEVI